MINNLSNPINLHKNLTASVITKNKPKYPLKSTYKLPTCTIMKKLNLPYIRPFCVPGLLSCIRFGYANVSWDRSVCTFPWLVGSPHSMKPGSLYREPNKTKMKVIPYLDLVMSTLEIK